MSEEMGPAEAMAEAMGQAMMTAAARTMARDELWRNPPPLAADCEHDLELLPVVELRQTVVCRMCGGLDVEASRQVLSCGVPPNPCD